MRTVLIDGDIWAYRACLRNEYEVDWGDDLWSLWGDLAAAQADFDASMKYITEALGADKVAVALSDKENFRKAILPTYKSNRKDKRKPVCYSPLREYIHEKYTTYQRPGLEGDDVLGILLTSPNILKGDKVLVSVDKDMMTLPGWHVNHTEATRLVDAGGEYEQAMKLVSIEEAERFHLVQTIAGDQSDGYSGVPGMGMVRALKLLEGGCVLEPHEHTFSKGARAGEKETRWEPGAAGTPWEIVVSAYRAAGLSEDVALTTARVARILRNTDYHFTKKEPILWNP